jgi:hypothetical protein
VKIIYFSFLFILTSFLSQSYAKTLNLSVEPGVVWTGYNYFQIPGSASASRVDLPKGKVLPAYRVSATFDISDNWSIRLLYAPLTARYNFTPSSAILFNGQSFGANNPMRVSYKFNSYRSSIVRKWGGENETQWSLGFTAKIRDAYIDLSNSNLKNRYSNVGFVPLIYLGFRTPITEVFAFSADLDGLAGGPGRAFDGKAQFEAKFAQRHKASLGYRFVEGGVKNEKVNNFALFHFLYAAYSIDF